MANCLTDGQVGRTYASEAVDFGSISGSGLAKDFGKMAFAAFLLAFSIKKNSVEKKPASTLVASLGK